MAQLKKLLLSVSVIITFIAYSFQQRHEASQAISTLPNNNGLATKQLVRGEGEDDGQTTVTPHSTSSQKPKTSSTGQYKDGSYTGQSADAYYGLIQVKVIISGGQITDVQFLNHPNDNPTSQSINSQAMPMLKQEAISAQSANVNGVSGATDTSIAFAQSLTSALSQAH